MKNNAIKIKNDLKQLTNIFINNNKKLYIVGGYIRDFFINNKLKNSDIDICSNVKSEDVEKYLIGSSYEIIYKNHDYGVLKILSKDGNVFEYTTFRIEKYNYNGGHYPVNIKFTDDINKDILRRDFTCNSIYYDIEENKFIDIYGGLNDIQNRIIKTLRDPCIVFSEDSERILRMIRLVKQFGFSVEKEVLNAALTNIEGIKNLSYSRFKNELNKINILPIGKNKILEEDISVLKKIIKTM